MDKKVLFGFGAALMGSCLAGAYIGSELRKAIIKKAFKRTYLSEEETTEKTTSEEENDTFEEGTGLEKELDLSNKNKPRKLFEDITLKAKWTYYGSSYEAGETHNEFNICYLDAQGKVKFRADVQCTEKGEAEKIELNHYDINEEETDRYPINVKEKEYTNIESILGIIEYSIKLILPIPGMKIEYTESIDRLIAEF